MYFCLCYQWFSGLMGEGECLSQPIPFSPVCCLTLQSPVPATLPPAPCPPRTPLHMSCRQMCPNPCLQTCSPLSAFITATVPHLSGNHSAYAVTVTCLAPHCYCSQHLWERGSPRPAVLGARPASSPHLCTVPSAGLPHCYNSCMTARNTPF